MGRVHWIIMVAASLGVVLGVQPGLSRGDTVIDVPSPPRAPETGSPVLDMLADAIKQAQAAAGGQQALMQYSTRRSAPRNVYTATPITRSSWSARANAYQHSWYVNNGPRIWGTWWPWGAWGGGCTMWTIGWPGQHGGMGSGCVGSGMTFAVLGGGY